MPSHTLTQEQEQEAQELARRIEAATRDDVLALARLLVSKPEAEIFGQAEFQARDLVHRIGAKVFEVHLAQKNGYRGSGVEYPGCQQAADVTADRAGAVDQDAHYEDAFCSGEEGVWPRRRSSS